MLSNTNTICLISPSLQMGGLERAMSNLANYFNSKGHKIYYVVLYKTHKFYQLNEGIELIEPEFNYDIAKPLYYFKIALYIRSKVKAIDPDTVLSFGDYHNALVLFSLLGTKIPVYVSDRSSPQKKFSKLYNLFKTFTYKKSFGVIAQTQRAAEQKRKMLGDKLKIVIIPNAIRKVEIYNIERKNYILGVGRHYNVKGFDRLIEAFSLLKSNWKLVLAGGGGPESSNLHSQVERLELTESVIFLGKVTDMDRVYSEAGIFVLTSRSEGFPNALCEAMSSGLACISYDINAGPADIIEDRVNGILIEDNNVIELRSAMQELILNEALRDKLGENAKLIQNKLSVEKSGDKYLKFITSHID